MINKLYYNKSNKKSANLDWRIMMMKLLIIIEVSRK